MANCIDFAIFSPLSRVMERGGLSCLANISASTPHKTDNKFFRKTANASRSQTGDFSEPAGGSTRTVVQSKGRWAHELPSK